MFEDAKVCLLCGDGVETLEHFVLDCSKLEHIRMRYVELQRPMIEQRDKIVRDLLMFGDKSADYYVNIVWEIWKERKKLMLQSKK